MVIDDARVRDVATSLPMGVVSVAEELVMAAEENEV